MMEFPANQYVAFMDRFTWLMDQEAIELSGGKTSKSTAARCHCRLRVHGLFQSIPTKIRWSFTLPAARFSIVDKIIEAREVEFIQVADAF